MNDPDKPATFNLVRLTADEISELNPGPIRHRLLPAELQGEVERSFRVVGRYFHDTLEQWELGFMRDFRPEREIRIWSWIVPAFLRYHQERGLPLRDDEVERDLICRIIEISTGVVPSDEEGQFIRECYLKPDEPHPAAR